MEKLRSLAARAKALLTKVTQLRAYTHAHRAAILVGAIAVLHFADQYVTSLPSNTILSVLKALIG